MDTTSEKRNLNVKDLANRLEKGHSQMKITKEELTDVLEHYKKLNVLYVDPES